MTLASVIESILFVYGEPIALKKLATAAGASEDDVRVALEELAAGYKDRGLILMEKDGMYQLGTQPDNTEYIERLVKDEFSADLSRSSLETVAVIAYKGPVSRAEIEHIRGVNCSFALRSLLMRGLIEREERAGDMRTYLYRVSTDFLKHLGIAKMEELPGYEELRHASASVIEVMPEQS